MSTIRAGYLISGLAFIALMSVYLRSEQARVATESLSAELRQVTVRRELWKQQAAVARLRAPEVIHDRIKVFDSQVEPPDSGVPQAPRPGAGTNTTRFNG